MAAGTEVNTVWIGFMDIVPVIGTVKEAVELVLALYEGNEAVVKKKEKAVEDFVKESFKKHVKGTYRGDEAAIKEKENIAEDNLKESFKKHVKLRDSEVHYFRPDGSRDGAAAEFSGLKNVKEVEIGMIIEYMVKGSKKGAKFTPAETEKRKKRLEEIKKDMVEKSRLIRPDFRCNQELKEELDRSKRGEHVFNNNILKFHSKVLNDFMQRNHNNPRGYNQQKKDEMDKLDSHTLDIITAKEIQDNMVVHFADDEFYVNANAVMYGEYCRALRDALLAVLNHINPGDETEEERERVNSVIDNMNNLEIYVDQLAKEKWINNRQDRQTRFGKVKVEVAKMYSEKRGLNWCNEIQSLVARLFV